MWTWTGSRYVHHRSKTLWPKAATQEPRKAFKIGGNFWYSLTNCIIWHSLTAWDILAFSWFKLILSDVWPLHVMCHFFSLFFDKCWRLSVEGLLSTGPTLSSLEQTLGRNAQFYNQSILYLSLTNCSMTSQKDMTENPRKSPRVPPMSATSDWSG